MGSEGFGKIRWGMVEDEVCSDLRGETRQVLDEIKKWVPEGYYGICDFFAKYPSLLEDEVDSDLEIECADVRDLIEGVFDYSCLLASSIDDFSDSEKLSGLQKNIEGLQNKYGFILRLRRIVDGVVGKENGFEILRNYRLKMIEKGCKPDQHFHVNWLKTCKDFDCRKWVFWKMDDDGVKFSKEFLDVWLEMICKDKEAESESKSAEISAWVAQARKILKLPMAFFKDLLANADGAFSRVTIFETFMQNGDWTRDEARAFFDHWMSLLDLGSDSGEISGINGIYRRRLEACGYDGFKLVRESPTVRVRRRSSDRS